MTLRQQVSLGDLLAADGTPITDRIKDILIQAAGQNVLFANSKQTTALIKCAYYLATQVKIIDESDKKKKQDLYQFWIMPLIF